MQTFTYAAEFEPGEKRGVVVVSFPDVPEAITQGDSPVDARAQAEEALGLALLTYPERGLPLMAWPAFERRQIDQDHRRLSYP